MTRPHELDLDAASSSTRATDAARDADRGGGRGGRRARRPARRSSGDRGLLADRVPEPDRQRDQVPRRRRRRACDIAAERDGERWEFAVPDNGIGDRRRVRRADLRDLPAPAHAGRLRGHRASAWRCAGRSSSTTAGGSGSTPAEAGGGARFRFTLPGRRRPPTEEATPHERTEHVDVIEVLLVEDDPGDVLMTQEAFEDNKVRNSAARRRRRRRGARVPAPARASTPTRRAPTWSCSTSTCRARTAARCWPRSRTTPTCARSRSSC